MCCKAAFVQDKAQASVIAFTYSKDTTADKDGLVLPASVELVV